MSVAGIAEAEAAHADSGLTIRRWTPPVGARVSGYRYDGGDVPDKVQETIKHALYQDGIVIFEPGTVTAQNFAEFVRFLGEPVSYGGKKATATHALADARRGSEVIDSEKDDLLRNHIWHIDGAYTPHPPEFTGLFAERIPGHGGETVFSNATHAYERFDPLFRDYLDTLTAITFSDATGHLVDRLRDPEELTSALAKNPAHEQPVARIHPITGRRQIAVNESYTHYIKGVGRQVSQHILNILFDAIKSPESTARLAWTEGTFAVWDNRVVQHRVIKDYDPHQRRLLFRVTVKEG